MTAFGPVLDGLTRVAGVRSALLVSADDGLPVADATMEGVDIEAAAALAASLVARLGRALGAAGHGRPTLVHLEAAAGSVMALPAGDELLLVAVCDPDANLGLLRLVLRDSVERLT